MLDIYDDREYSFEWAWRETIYYVSNHLFFSDYFLDWGF